MRNLTRTALSFSALILTCSIANADQWSDRLISTQKIDFGVIATGSESQKLVEIKNVYPETVHIAGVSTSCSCASGKLDTQTLQPGESCFVEVKMDTQKFRQRKDSNLLIRFDLPRNVEHRIPITAYIRTDVVFTPGLLRFGDVELGQSGKAVVDIAYAGRSDWDIVNIKFDNQNLKAALSPPIRANGAINYKLSLTLSDKVPAGRIRDLITIVTNDRTNPYIPVLVDGMVVADITFSPSVLEVGSIGAGQTARVKVALKGTKPFQVEDIDCAEMADCFKAQLADTARKFHVVPIEFNAPNRPGKFTEELIVKIVGRPEPLRLNVTGVIVN